MAATVGPSTPTSTPPTSQSMNARDSPGRFSGEGTPDYTATDAVDRSSSSTPSPSRQLESQSSVLSKEEEYRQLFRLPPDEVLIQDFNCALQENFLLQGHMYLFAHYICFYSNLFGFETKKIIPFHEVTSVRRAKAVAVFPTAIEIIAGEKKFFFTSFLSRDEACRLIEDGWLQNSNESKEIKDLQETQSDVSSQMLDSIIVGESDSSILPADDVRLAESDQNGHISEESELSNNVKPEIVSTSSGVPAVPTTKEETAEPVQTTDCSSSEKSSSWEPEDTDAPGVLECFTKVAEAKFPICVEDFFNLFFSDSGISFHEAFHRKCGDKDFKCTTWRPDAKLGHARDVSFQHPIKIYFGARFGSCRELQKYRVFKNSHLIIDTSQDIDDVPYGDYFSVEGRWDVEEESTGSSRGCVLRVYTNVAFSKKTMWKGKIVQSTVEETREAYGIWIELAHEMLKQKNLEKDEADLASSLISNKQVQLETRPVTQSYAELKSNDVGVSQVIPDQTIADAQVNGPVPGSTIEPSARSVVGDIFTKFPTSLKLRNSPVLLLVAILAVILILMQISILVLMSRPQRIQIVPQGSCMGSMNGMGESRSEAVAYLNKQIRYLKEEMHFMETLLDKMQHEHALLKEKLKDLELYRNKRM